MDGDGGTAPVIINGTLAANTTYSGTVDLLNESEEPAEDIGAEVAEEDDHHQLFYELSSGLNMTIEYADFDGDGNPLGLMTTLTTEDASSGQLTCTLRHQPEKDEPGVADGDITNAGGETDIEVQFEVTIQ